MSHLQSPRYLAAVAYAERGIAIFPCRVGEKRPATLHGLKDRTTDLQKIKDWWTAADYNFAIVPEDSGWCVVDIDPKNNGLIHWEEAARGKMTPPTRTIITPSGGFHLYFIGSLQSSAGRIAEGVDTRGRGSYVLVPPSVVNGAEYREAA